MGRPKGGSNKYWSKEEKLKLIKEHIENHVSTNEITTREHISNGMYNNWLKKYLEFGEKGLENKKKPGNPLSKYIHKKNLTDKEMTNTYFYNYNTLNINKRIVAPKGVCYCLAVKK